MDFPRPSTDGSLGNVWFESDELVAQIAGAAALLKSQFPKLHPNQLRSTLKRTVSVPDGYDKAYYGTGYLDTRAALIQ